MYTPFCYISSPLFLINKCFRFIQWPNFNMHGFPFNLCVTHLRGHCIMTPCSRVGGSHGNMMKPDGGGFTAERDVTPKLNLWYKFSNCCCHADRSISHLSLTKK